jgi:hypothetical protein
MSAYHGPVRRMTQPVALRSDSLYRRIRQTLGSQVTFYHASSPRRALAIASSLSPVASPLGYVIEHIRTASWLAVFGSPVLRAHGSGARRADGREPLHHWRDGCLRQHRVSDGNQGSRVLAIPLGTWTLPVHSFANNPLRCPVAAQSPPTELLKRRERVNGPSTATRRSASFLD